MKPFNCAYNPRGVADQETLVVDWKTLRKFIPTLPVENVTPPTSIFHGQYFSFIFIATAKPRLVRIGVSAMPRTYVRSMTGEKALTITKALTGQTPSDPVLRLIVPNSTIRTLDPFDRFFAEQALGSGWYTGQKVFRVLSQLEKSAKPFSKRLR